MKTKRSCRPIDQRRVPPVAGLDLEQALNYIAMDIVGEAFIYEHYTSRRLFYVPGSRPRLERVAKLATRGARTRLRKTQALARWVSTHVQWAGYYMKKKGRRLPTDRNPSEEQLIRTGYGWCNEQARLFCLLTQVCGIPSRLVFASNQALNYGHCISEVLPGENWLAVDQSLGYCFVMNKSPVRASRLFHDPRARSYFTPIYKRLCRSLLEELGPDAEKDFAMAAGENPLDGFTNLGFLNYFAH